jgi:hypothetical protein
MGWVITVVLADMWLVAGRPSATAPRRICNGTRTSAR